MVIGEAPEEFWQKNFRLSKEELIELVGELKEYITPDPKSPNYY